MARNESGSVTPRFQVGDKVRVEYGATDPDFPDIPLGGWSEIIEHEDQINRVFVRDGRTLACLWLANYQ